MPCIYFADFAQGKCYRDQCPFKHEVSAAPATAKATPKPKVAPAKPGLVALLAATVIAATASLPPMASGPMFHDFVGDTSAGGWLSSWSAFHNQAIDDQQLDCWVGNSHQPLRFTTGGGTKPARSTVGIWSHETQRMSNLYMLEDCPLAFSTGQLVNKSRFSCQWEPSRLPWLQSPDGECVQAHHADHNVPIFRFQCELQYGLPLLPSPGGESRDSNSSRCCVGYSSAQASDGFPQVEEGLCRSKRWCSFFQAWQTWSARSGGAQRVYWQSPGRGKICQAKRRTSGFVS